MFLVALLLLFVGFVLGNMELDVGLKTMAAVNQVDDNVVVNSWSRYMAIGHTFDLIYYFLIGSGLTLAAYSFVPKGKKNVEK